MKTYMLHTVVAVLAGSIVQFCAAEDALTPEQTLATLATSLEQRSLRGEKAAPYNEELLFLAHVYGDISAEQHYNNVFRSLEKRKDPSSLPALEAFLNRDIWGRLDRGMVKDLIKRYHIRATELWYDIKWSDPNLTVREKYETALYGLRPDTPVRLHFQVSAERLKKLGAAARPTLYRFLVADNVDYKQDGWTVNALTRLIGVLNEEDLKPTAPEIEQVLKSSNLFARLAVVQVLLSQSDDRAADALVDWFADIEGKSRTLINHGLVYAGEGSGLTPPAKQKLRELVGRIVEPVWEKALKEPSWQDGAILYYANRAMAKLGPADSVKAYFEQYMQRRQTMQAGVLADQPSGPFDSPSDVEIVLFSADRIAIQALANFK